MKRVLVTGSTRGIGKAIAQRLAQDGFEVIIHGAKNASKANELKKLIENEGGSARVELCDLCNLEETRALCRRLPELDAVVLNASLQYKTPWQDIGEDEAYEQINCNFLSSLIIIQSAVPHMKENGWGRIVSIGSVQEKKPHPDMLIYSATKAAQTNMTESLALQLAGFGITVNNVAPGVIYTDRNIEALSDEAYAKKVTASIPAGFYGVPEDCAGTVSLLLSDDARYITGQSIYIDGGKSL